MPVAGVVLAASVALRSAFQVDVLTDRGALARVVEGGAIENVYRRQIMNRAEIPQTHRIDVQGIHGQQVQTSVISAPPAGIRSVAVSLRLPHSAAQGLLGPSAPVLFEVSLRCGTLAAAAVRREKSTLLDTALSGPQPAPCFKTQGGHRTAELHLFYQGHVLRQVVGARCSACLLSMRCAIKALPPCSIRPTQPKLTG